MNKSAISSIATEVHELDVQSTKCAHLDDNWMKTLPLDSSDAVASEVTTHIQYMGSESMTKTDCLSCSPANNYYLMISKIVIA